MPIENKKNAGDDLLASRFASVFDFGSISQFQQC